MHRRWPWASLVLLSCAACVGLESRTAFATNASAPPKATLTATAATRPSASPIVTLILATSAGEPAEQSPTASLNGPATVTPMEVRATPSSNTPQGKSPTASPTRSRTPTPTPLFVLTGTQTPTPSAVSTRTPTPGTPTVGPNLLYYRVPDEGAILDARYSWLFIWWADPDPCFSAITINGPGGRRLGDSEVTSTSVDHRYVYDTPQDLPPDAVGAWHWYVDVFCPTGSIDGSGSPRTFYFFIETPTPFLSRTPGPTATPFLTRTPTPTPFFTRTPAPTPTPFSPPTGTSPPMATPTPGP